MLAVRCHRQRPDSRFHVREDAGPMLFRVPRPYHPVVRSRQHQRCVPAGDDSAYLSFMTVELVHEPALIEGENREPAARRGDEGILPVMGERDRPDTLRNGNREHRSARFEIQHREVSDARFPLDDVPAPLVFLRRLDGDLRADDGEPPVGRDGNPHGRLSHVKLSRPLLVLGERSLVHLDIEFFAAPGVPDARGPIVVLATTWRASRVIATAVTPGRILRVVQVSPPTTAVTFFVWRKRSMPPVLRSQSTSVPSGKPATANSRSAAMSSAVTGPAPASIVRSSAGDSRVARQR